MKKGKIHYVLGICILAFSQFCFKSATNCSQIRNGKFYYFAKKSRERIDVFRKDSLQLEIGLKKGDVPLKNKIIWKNDCEYDMYINALSESPLTGDDSILASTAANVKIVQVEATFYVSIAKLSVFDQNLEFRDTLFIVK